MNVKLAAGVEVDLATKGDLQQLKDDLQGSGLPILPRRIYQAATVPTPFSAGSFLMEVDHPETPVIWDLRKLVILGADDHTAVANVSAAVYVGSAAPNGQVSLLDCAWQGMTLPSSNTFNAQCLIGHHERLFVLFAGTGLVAGQQLVVVGQVIEVPNDRVNRYLD